jgi:hypothetical protein
VEGDPTGRRQLHESSSRALLVLTLVCAGLFATTVGPRPTGLAWDRLFDVALYNAAYLTAAAACW